MTKQTEYETKLSKIINSESLTTKDKGRLIQKLYKMYYPETKFEQEGIFIKDLEYLKLLGIDEDKQETVLFDQDKIFKLGNVIHCNTQQKADALCKWLLLSNYCWCGGESYYNTKWKTNKEQMCYYPSEGQFASLIYFTSNSFYTILNYEDVLLYKKDNK